MSTLGIAALANAFGSCLMTACAPEAVVLTFSRSGVGPAFALWWAAPQACLTIKQAGLEASLFSPGPFDDVVRCTKSRLNLSRDAD